MFVRLLAVLAERRRTAPQRAAPRTVPADVSSARATLVGRDVATTGNRRTEGASGARGGTGAEASLRG